MFEIWRINVIDALFQQENPFKRVYKNNKLIRIQKDAPLIKDVINTNYAIIGGFSISDDGQNLVTCCVIDNLLKGAASQCIQNLNIAFGFEESLSLEDTFN